MLAREVQAWIKSFDPIPKLSDIQVVSGHHWEGADKIGEDWAKKYGIPIEPYPADWNRLGKMAGPVRNRAMALYATHCICFWNGKVKGSGTKNMIDEATAAGLHLKVVRYK